LRKEITNYVKIMKLIKIDIGTNLAETKLG